MRGQPCCGLVRVPGGDIEKIIHMIGQRVMDRQPMQGAARREVPCPPLKRRTSRQAPTAASTRPAPTEIGIACPDDTERTALRFCQKIRARPVIDFRQTNPRITDTSPSRRPYPLPYMTAVGIHGEEVRMKKIILYGGGVAVLPAGGGAGLPDGSKPALVHPGGERHPGRKVGILPQRARRDRRPSKSPSSTATRMRSSPGRWKLASGGMVRKSWSGDAKYLPASLTWDGKGDSGTMAPEGTYTAKLSIEYASKYQPASAESKSFVLDIAPPIGLNHPRSPAIHTDRTTASRDR